MNIPLTYGLVGALLGALQTLVLFFLGIHGERVHLMHDWKFTLPLGIVGFAIGVTVQVLGMRAARNAAGDRGMSYGRGLGVGCLIGLWQGLATMVFMIVYGFVINPGFKDAMIAGQLAKMQEQNMPAEAYAMAEKMMGFMLNPAVQGVMAFFGAIFMALIIGLIAAAFLRRAPAEPSFAASNPPALG